MVDFTRARNHMVDNQLLTGGVTDPALRARMRVMPREAFVPAERRDLAYVDALHRFENGRFMVSPVALGRLIQLCEIQANDSVLVIGTTTGYAAAVVAGLAREVVGYEPDENLAATARTMLAQRPSISIVSGDFAQLAGRTFDAVLVEGAIDQVPTEWLDALAHGGRLAAVVQAAGVGTAQVYVKTGREVTCRREFNLTVPMFEVSASVQPFVF
jgi:protein-L-isoaspartate(D-aspartate) O-methyltransferase